MPTNTELARDIRLLEERILAMEAGLSAAVTVGTSPANREAFVEAIIAAAVARDGSKCLTALGNAEPAAVRAIREAEACRIVGLELLGDVDWIAMEVSKRRRKHPAAVA